MPVRTGFIHGTGAAINVEIGFVPDYVKILDWTNGNIVTEGFMQRVVVFTSMSKAIVTGNWIKGATSGARARVNEVIIDSGTVAGGDAAGWLICDAEEIGDESGAAPASEHGTLQTETAQVHTSKPSASASGATDDLSIVVDTELCITTAAAVATATTAAAQVNAYTGTEATRRKGFTLGATVSQDGVLLFYIALGNDQGMGGVATVLGNDQNNATIW